MRNLCIALSLFVLASTLHAEGLSIAATDTTVTVLGAQKGKRVTLRLKSGQELSGSLRDVTEKLVLLEGLAGREFFDAVIPIDSVEAIILRTKP
ncbi:MAG: hypothetical protein KF778_15425 [Rhodocyclaceae bacterium]|nr:hypothetical protein [Rhodocyclaceae bacterium]MBX3669791.1 hypothetical protein [Rhodocyclaceae bacterium]